MSFTLFILPSYWLSVHLLLSGTSAFATSPHGIEYLLSSKIHANKSFISENASGLAFNPQLCLNNFDFTWCSDLGYLNGIAEYEEYLSCFDFFELPTPEVSGFCNDDVTIVFEESSSGNSCQWEENYTWTATDNCGTTLTVVINLIYEDNNPPHIFSYNINQGYKTGGVDETPGENQLVATIIMNEDDIEITEVTDFIVDGTDDCGGEVSVFENSDFECPFWFGFEGPLNEMCKVFTLSDGCNESLAIIHFIYPEIEGCTDPCAINFDPEANYDDWSCLYPNIGAFFSSTPNDASISCSNTAEIVYPVMVSECGIASITLEQETVPGPCEGSYDLVNTFTAEDSCCVVLTHTQTISIFDTDPPAIDGEPEVEVSALDGIYITAEDACSLPVSIVYDDILLLQNQFLRIYTVSDGCGNTILFDQIVTILIPGCTDPSACNYNPAANVDDESQCIFGGCTNASACNFDPNASCADDDLCIFGGCQNASACNYDPDAACSIEDLCIFGGCTIEGACNFDPDASCADDGSCIFGGCLDPDACNYDSDAACDGDNCIYAYGSIGLSTQMTTELLGSTYFQLIKRGESVSSYVIADEIQSSGQFFSFEEVPEGLYHVRTVPSMESVEDPDNLIASYSNQSYYWEYADTIEVGCGSYEEMGINLIQQTTLSGSGTIVGKIVHAGVSSAPNYESEIPAIDAALILVDLNATMENSDLNNPVNYTRTDDAGEYIFEALSAGQYSIYVDIPGLPMLSHYSIDLAPGEDVVNRDFYVVGDQGIHTGSILGISSNSALELAIYPNPFRNGFTLQFGSGTLHSEDIQWEICDLLGKKLLEGQCFYEKSCEVYSNTLAPGAYIIKAYTRTSALSAKIIKH